MRAPAFWSHDGLLPRLLTPCGALYGAATRLRLQRAGMRIDAQVICCGNATAGGTGKTILALAIAAALQARGERPAFLTRGYGGSLKGPLQVDPTRHGARDVGDEALLLAARAPTYLGRNRAAAARLAHGITHLVLDDGLQNSDLLKDVSFLVIDGGAGFGNNRLIPAGPLREPVRRAANRVQAVVLIGEDDTGAALLLPPALPVLRANLVTSHALRGEPVVAFAGIGRPQKFLTSLEAAGAVVTRFVAFPDHHFYSRGDLAMLHGCSREFQARLVTTEKDWVRLDRSERTGISFLSVTLNWQQPDALAAVIKG